MKRTLRVLFLAVLAMALMASGAFAAGITKESFDVKIGDAGAETLSTKLESSDTTPTQVSADKGFKIEFKLTGAKAKSASITLKISSAVTSMSIKSNDTENLTVTSLEAGISGDVKITVELTSKDATAFVGTAASKDITFTFTATSSDKTTKMNYKSIVKVVAAAKKDEGGTDTTAGGAAFIGEEGFLVDDTEVAFTISGDEWQPVEKTLYIVISDSLGATGEEEVTFDLGDDGAYEDYFTITPAFVESSDSDGTNTTFTYTVTFEVVDGSFEPEDEYTVSNIVIGDLTSFDPEGTFTVVFSADASSDGTTTEATATIDVSGDQKIGYFEEKAITIKVSPYRTAGYKIAETFTNNSGGSLTSTDMTQGAIHVSATNQKTYTYKAGGTKGKDTLVFKVSSGDTTIDTFTINFDVAMNADNPATPSAPELLGVGALPPEYKALFASAGIKFYENLEELAAAFSSGKGIVAWGMKAPGKVKRSNTSGSWILYFLGKSHGRRNLYVKQYIGVLLDVNSTSGASIAAETTSDDCLIDPVSDDVAIYQVNIENTAAGLEEDDEFGVNCSYQLEEYEDEGIDKEATASEVGTIEGTMPSETGATGILGNSSGGCDAGFGAMALALAATLFLGKKRS